MNNYCKLFKSKTFYAVQIEKESGGEIISRNYFKINFDDVDGLGLDFVFKEIDYKHLHKITYPTNCLFDRFNYNSYKYQFVKDGLEFNFDDSLCYNFISKLEHGKRFIECSVKFKNNIIHNENIQLPLAMQVFKNIIGKSSSGTNQL